MYGLGILFPIKKMNISQIVKEDCKLILFTPIKSKECADKAKSRCGMSNCLKINMTPTYRVYI